MTTNTRPVPNTQSAIAATADGKIRVFLITPWTQFFQQFVQKAPAAVPITLPNPLPTSDTPFLYTANQRGKIMIDWYRGTSPPLPVTPPDPPPIVTFSRGDLSSNPFTIDLTGVHIIPIAIGDTISVYRTLVGTQPYTLNFLGD